MQYPKAGPSREYFFFIEFRKTSLEKELIVHF